MLSFLSCFSCSRASRSGHRRQLRDTASSGQRLSDQEVIIQTKNQTAKVALQGQKEPDTCPSPFCSANIAPVVEGDIRDHEIVDQVLAPGLFMFRASSGSSKSKLHSFHGLTTSNPLANDHLEGHLLPAGLELSALQHLLDSANVSTTPSRIQETHGSCLFTVRLGSSTTPSGAADRPARQDRPTVLQPLDQHQVPQELRDTPDLHSLTCEQLVRLCQPEDITSDLAGLKLVGTGRRSVTCQALWRGARVAVKFTSSPSLHPSSSAIIKQALVSKALAHPNVLQHYSVRCCRLTPAPVPVPVLDLCLQGPDMAASVLQATTAAAGGVGDNMSAASAPSSFAQDSRQVHDTAAAAAVAIAKGVTAACYADDSGSRSALAPTVLVLHHLSGPAATGPASSRDHGTRCGASCTPCASCAAEQISDLFTGTSGSANAASAATAMSAAASHAQRVLRAPRQLQPAATRESVTVPNGGVVLEDARPAGSPPIPAKRPPPAPIQHAAQDVCQPGYAFSGVPTDREGVDQQRKQSAALTAASALSRGGGAHGAGAGAAAAAGCATAMPMAAGTDAEGTGSGCLERAPVAPAKPSSPAPAPALAAAVIAATAAAAAAAHGTTSSPVSYSFNSYEGFGDPFGSLRQALSLTHVAALLSAVEGEYMTTIIMEHADKSTLQQAVQRGLFAPNRVWSGRVALRALLRTSLELAFALQHLHGRGVVHGSLRPTNVLLKSSNIDRRGFTAKVSNFSLARVCLGNYDELVLSPMPVGLQRESPEAAAPVQQDRGPTRASRSGTGAGAGARVDAAALPFWSPEQLCGVVGKASDVYAFGVTLYFMSTGLMPYGDLPAEDVVRRVAAGELRPQWPDGGADGGGASTAPPAMIAAPGPAPAPAPAPLRSLCALCWQADPRARPTFSQICASLQSIEHAVRQQLRKPGCTQESPGDSGPHVTPAAGAPPDTPAPGNCPSKWVEGTLE